MKRILIIEDDDDIREAISDLLTDSGYQTVESVNGHAALELLERDRSFDLLLLDIMMPVVDGGEFLRRRAHDPALSAIPAIVMSADGHARRQHKLNRIDCFVKKPIDLQTFLGTVETRLMKGFDSSTGE